MREQLDLTGRRFGSWTVVDRAEWVGTNARWNCRCSCGRVKVVWQMALRNGSSSRCQSCASSGTRNRRVDMLAKRFGRWLVLEEGRVEERNGRKTLWWWCRCDCGTQQEVRGSSLRAGQTRGCAWCQGGRRPRNETED